MGSIVFVIVLAILILSWLAARSISMQLYKRLQKNGVANASVWRVLAAVVIFVLIVVILGWILVANVLMER